MSKDEKISDCVQVALRIRPFIQSEIDLKCAPVVIKIDNEPQVLINTKKSETFTFNNVFDCFSNQKMLYDESVSKMLDKLFEGYNVTILAYGQTGSGKTFTMGTNYDGSETESMGVIPRAAQDIFKKIEELKDTHKIKVKCAFIELYQEQLYDLLSKLPRDKCVLDIREDSVKGIIIPGLTEREVTSAAQTIECLQLGSSGRTVGATAMNSESSRSHAIFTIKLEMKTETRSTVSRFHLVDLAGSERSKKTQATGDRFKEGVNINRGLLALGNVISALGSTNNAGFISYRDSKLTRLLQDSLGGNSLTLMIACVSPANYNIEETLNTLRYADRAKRIKNKPVINQDPLIAKICKLQLKVSEMEVELASLQKYGQPEMDESLTLDDFYKSESYRVRIAEKDSLTQQMMHSLEVIANLELRAECVENVDVELVDKCKIIKRCVEQMDLAFQGEDCPAHIQIMKEIREIVNEIDEILAKLTNHIDKHYSIPLISRRSSRGGSEEELETQKESVVLKEYLNKIGDLNNEIGDKQLDHERAIQNYQKLMALEKDGDIENEIKEYRNKIEELEEKKMQLDRQAPSNKSKKTEKLDGERLKQIEGLESKIKIEQKKLNQLTTKLNMRTKEAEQIKVLHEELTTLKKRKVELIREMKKTSDSFKKEKKEQERQMLQLKTKTRKVEIESVREAQKHSKQQRVLNMKLQKAKALNARLENLEIKRQNVMKINMSKAGSTKFNFATFKNTLKSHIMIAESQNCYRALIDSRTVLQDRLTELKSNSLINAPEIKEIEDELNTVKSLITQARAETPDTNEIISQLFATVKTTEQHATVFKYLLRDIIQSQANLFKAQRVADERTLKSEEYQQMVENFELEMKSHNAELKQKLMEIKVNGEMQIEVMLDLMNHTQTDKTQHFADIKEKKLLQMRDELENLKKEEAALSEEFNNSKFRRPRAVTTQYYNDQESQESITYLDSDLDDEMMDIDDEDDDDDPDWRMTPMKQRSSVSSSDGEKDKMPRKRSKDHSIHTGCKCRGNCLTKRCGCRKNDDACNEADCKCSSECQNIRIKPETNGKDDLINETFEIKRIKFDNDENVPANYASTPQKYLLADGVLDCTSPSYPFANRQKAPYFNK